MFLYKRATIDRGFEFVDVESIYLKFVIKYFLVGVGFLSSGVWFIIELENRSPAVPNS